MGLEDWKEVLGNSATICSIGMFLSGLEVCYKFYKNKTTGEVSPMSFLVGIVMTFVWFYYGLLIGDGSISRVNGTGLVLQSLYTVIFLYFSSDKPNMIKKMILVFIIVGGLSVYIYTGSDVTGNVGLIGSAMSIAYCGAPLASVSHVIRTKSTEVLPFYLILMTALVTGQWTLYGFILADPYLKIPNSIGCLIALLQLVLFVVFPVKSIGGEGDEGKMKVLPAEKSVPAAEPKMFGKYNYMPLSSKEPKSDDTTL